jgi:hypothetical protein
MTKGQLTLIETCFKVSNRSRSNPAAEEDPYMPTVHKARGRPFEPRNPGRPLGSKNKTTQMVEQLAEGQAEQLVQKALELAHAGDVSCLRMMLDRLWPLRKGQPVNMVMPPINDAQDVLLAIASIWTAIREGRLTPDEASALSLVAERSMQVINQQELLKRIEELEKHRELRDAKANFKTP